MSTANPLDETNKSGIVMGLKDFGVFNRQDINVLLFQAPVTFNMFPNTLKKLQEKNWELQMNYYQIAGKSFLSLRDKLLNIIVIPGIHGSPCAEWNKIKPKNEYATSYLPLHKTIIDFADKYDELRKKVYKEAVKEFRLPSWDYHQPKGYNAISPVVVMSEGTTKSVYNFRVPQILTVPRVNVKM
ncbi:hypothetical protein CC78DRAFT_610029 [Lojkania enalia]|uniref:Uncharacterized protein n=1 Tax=Lojkania enalia TaxID=147567 RepID=A0A9P4N3D1_9PLEO|nr:hypothetical protein CC78DRAFT_610029 [Didymosphaeria enalia]